MSTSRKYSAKRAAASRANGKRSRGPCSPTSIDKARRAALRHGLTARCVLIPGESQKEYDTFLAAFVKRFNPACAVEMTLVENMAVAQWRLRRIAVLEGNLIANELTDNRDYEGLNPEQTHAWAFDRCSRAISLLTRYESTLNRTFERALKQLQVLQNTPPTAPPSDGSGSFRNFTRPTPAPLPPPTGGSTPNSPRLAAPIIASGVPDHVHSKTAPFRDARRL